MKKFIFYLILTLSVVLGGCTRNQPSIEGQDKHSVKEPNTISVQAQDEDIIERSESISDVVVELYGIDDATTIVLDNEALVGVRIAYDEKLTSETKDLIEATIRFADSEITNIFLTDNPKTFADINDLVIDILQGESYDSYLSKIKSIKSRIK